MASAEKPVLLPAASRIWPLLAGAAIVVAGCRAPEYPRPQLLSVTPARAWSGASPTLRIEGRGFRVGLGASLRGDAPRIDAEFHLWLGDDALTGVQFMGTDTLLAQLPAGLSPGVRSLRLRTPQGIEATLEAAFEITEDRPPIVSTITPTRGLPDGGESLTLTGIDFTPDAYFRFGETPLRALEILSDTLAVATAPAGEGAVDLVVGNDNGESVLAQAFSYREPPLITSVEPALIRSVGGTRLRIRGYGLTTGQRVEVDGKALLDITVVDDQTLEGTAPPGEGDVAISLLGADGVQLDFFAGALSYVAPLAITEISPDRGPPEGGTLVDIRGQGFAGETRFSFGELPLVGLVLLDSSHARGRTPPGHGVTDVSVQSPVESLRVEAAFTYLADDPCDGADDRDGDGHASARCGGGDCNDADASIHPGASEHCDGVDNDCDDSVDELCDADLDGYCDATRQADLSSPSCWQGIGDCNDADPDISPGATEICDRRDNDCDGETDEGCDDDEDGFCDRNMPLRGAACAHGGGDCDDDDPGRYPGALERCNTLDDDCDGVVPEAESDGCPPP